MDTLLLDNVSWDLVLDASNNIAVASDPYSQAQDAASACETFQGEVYFDTNLGVPLWQQVFGHFPNPALLKQAFTDAALAVPGVTAAQSFISSLADRTVTGQVQITNRAGATAAARLAATAPAGTL